MQITAIERYYFSSWQKSESNKTQYGLGKGSSMQYFTTAWSANHGYFNGGRWGNECCKNKHPQSIQTCGWAWRLSQSMKLSRKEKNKYCLLTHVCGIQKSGIDGLICKAEMETQIENKCLGSKGEQG